MNSEDLPEVKPEAFRVLIVEDSRATRMVIRAFMLEFGFEIDEASDGSEALKFLSSGKCVKLIVCDWEMPVMNGLEFVRNYRASNLPFCRDTPILMSTRLNTTEAIQKALATGANDYIMKPFTKEIFASKLDLLGIDHK